MVYLDTSVLLAFILTKRMEPAKFQAASRLADIFLKLTKICVLSAFICVL